MLAAPRLQPLLARACGGGDDTAAVVIWGASGLAVSVARRAVSPGGGWEVVRTVTSEGVGVTSLERRGGSSAAAPRVVPRCSALSEPSGRRVAGLLLRQLEEEEEVSGCLGSPFNRVALAVASEAPPGRRFTARRRQDRERGAARV